MNNIIGNVHVTGEIETHVPPKLAEQNRAANEKKEAREGRKLILEFITVLLIALYAGLTLWQASLTNRLLKTAQDTYAAIDRPYVGMNLVNVTPSTKDAKGSPAKAGKSPRVEVTGITYQVEIKNFGSVIGEDFRQRFEVRINGQEVLAKRISDTASEIFPGESVYVFGQVSGDPLKLVVQGKSILQFDLSADYAYGGKQYHYCERAQFIPNPVEFVKLGPICDKPWASGK
jgi:hypothetical protein